MCKSIADGGQRCASHTRTAFFKAQIELVAAYRTDDERKIRDASDNWQMAAAQYASTDEGRHALLAQAHIAETQYNWEAATGFHALAAQGQRIREINKEAARVLKAQKARHSGGSTHARG